MSLTKPERDALPSSMFAVPKKRALPFHDEVHCRMCWSQIDHAKGLSDEERATARRRCLRRAKQLGIDTSEWIKSEKMAAYAAEAETNSEELEDMLALETGLAHEHRLSALSAEKIDALRLDAMALNIPDDDDHPNKMPFSGLLVRLDQASDAAPHGSNGRRIVVSAEAAEKALGSLLGMGVNLSSDLGGHDRQAKVGIITAATIEGQAIVIEGFVYKADFPKEAIAIRAQKSSLGFSFEAENIECANIADDPLVITALTFTGAAILKKNKAAYTTTSLAASKEMDNAATPQEDFDMTKEELAALLKEGIADAVAPINDRLAQMEASAKAPQRLDAASMRETVEPHATALEACANSMEAAGIGMHPTQGHVAKLRKLAGSMRAAAAMGHLPTAHNDHDWWTASADAGGKDAKEEKPAPAIDAAALAEAMKAAVAPLNEQIAAMGTKLEDVKARSFLAAQQPERKTLPAQITSLLARTGVVMPGEGEGISLATLEDAMSKAGISDPKARIAMKRAAGH